MGDGSGLENRRGESPWGFDSLPSRQMVGGRLTAGYLTLNQMMRVRVPPSHFGKIAHHVSRFTKLAV